MLSQSLSSRPAVEWTMRQSGSSEWLPAVVPGGVHTDLMAAGKIPDPFFADNELKVQWVAEAEWEYRGVFTASKALVSAPHLFLVADGLDTFADVTLNGRPLGSAENMFRQYTLGCSRTGSGRFKRDSDFLPLGGKLLPGAQPGKTADHFQHVFGGQRVRAQGALPLRLGLGTDAAADRCLARPAPGRFFGGPD